MWSFWGLINHPAPIKIWENSWNRLKIPSESCDDFRIDFKFAAVFSKKRIASRALPLREGKQIVVSLRGDFLNQVEKHCGYRNFMWSDPSMMSSFFVAFLSLKTIQKIFDMTSYFTQNRTLWPGQSLSSPSYQASWYKLLIQNPSARRFCIKPPDTKPIGP